MSDPWGPAGWGAGLSGASQGGGWAAGRRLAAPPPSAGQGSRVLGTLSATLPFPREPRLPAGLAGFLGSGSDEVGSACRRVCGDRRGPGALGGFSPALGYVLCPCGEGQTCPAAPSLLSPPPCRGSPRAPAPPAAGSPLDSEVASGSSPFLTALGLWRDGWSGGDYTPQGAGCRVSQRAAGKDRRRATRLPELLAAPGRRGSGARRGPCHAAQEGLQVPPRAGVGVRTADLWPEQFLLSFSITCGVLWALLEKEGGRAPRCPAPGRALPMFWCLCALPCRRERGPRLEVSWQRASPASCPCCEGVTPSSSSGAWLDAHQLGNPDPPSLP